jgi:hypothetical protein
MQIPVRGAATVLVTALVVLAAPSLSAQKIDEETRYRNREQLSIALRSAADVSNLNFQPAKVNKFNFSANLTTGLRNAESIEVVVGATDVDTIFLHAYPKYQGAFMNVEKVKNPTAMMRQILKLSGRTFCHWGTDAQGDIFFGFTFTLESGFPVEAIRVVLRSIGNHDQYIAELLATQ